MKVSQNTLKTIRNFARISNGLAFKAGSELSAVSKDEDIIARATIPETWPRDFTVVEIATFLKVLGIFTDPELEFGDDAVRIFDATSSMKYRYSEPGSVPVARKIKNIAFPFDVEFMLESAAIGKILEVADQLDLPEMQMSGAESKVTIKLTNKKNPLANEFSLEIGAATVKSPFSLLFNVESFQLLPGNYQVSLLSEKNYGRFKHVEQPVEYWISAFTPAK